MKIFTSPLRIGAMIAVALYSVCSHSEEASREQLIRQLIQYEQGAKQESIELLTARALLSRAKQLNPDIGPDKWLEIEKEVTASVAEMVARSGGTIDVMTRAGVADLSDAELAHLVSIYRDPVLVKYTGSLSSPVIESQVQQASIKNALQVAAVINSVMERHGLHALRQ